jgi:hypothetical protein
MNGGTGSGLNVTRATSFGNNGVIRTAGEWFHDGSALELFRAPSEPEEVKLLHWNGSVLKVAAHVEHAGRKYAPVAIEPSVKKALRLPTQIAPPETTRQLFDSVHDLLSSRLGQLESCITRMVFAVFESWLAPVLPMAPLLWVFAPAGSPKNLVLQLLSLVCRRSLSLVAVRRADLLRLPMALHPTLLLDEPDIQPAMQTLLQASSHRGLNVTSGRGVVELFGPKIIFSRKLPHGTALETDVFRTALIPVPGQLPPLDRATEENIAEEFQARFMGYFLRNFSRVRRPSIDVTNLTGPVQDLARSLGAAVVDDELQKRIVSLLADEDEEIRADCARSFDSVVVEAGLFFIHQGGWSKVRAESTAEKVEAIYKGRGSDQKVSPESVGWAWRRLGIPSGRINRAGNGIELTVATSRLIHRLAISFGVRAIQGGLRADCRYCRELEPMIQHARANVVGSGS